MFVISTAAKARTIVSTAQFFLFLFIMEMKLLLTCMELIVYCLACSVVMYS